MKSLEDILWSNQFDNEENQFDDDIDLNHINVNCMEICCTSVCCVPTCGCLTLAVCFPPK